MFRHLSEAFISRQKQNLKPTLSNSIYYKNEKGKPPKNELLVLTPN